MKVQTLKNKLNKENISFKITTTNDYNFDIEFKINNINFVAGFNKDNDTIIDYCREFDFDNENQETHRRFFDNFNHLKNYANII